MSPQPRSAPPATVGREHTCTIANDNGEPVEYRVSPHRTSQGLQVAARLFALAGPSLGSALGKVNLADIRRLTDLDLDLGAVAGELARAVASEDLAGLASDLLRNVIRGGVPLDHPGAVDLAYAGNYGELAEALVWVIQINGFLRFFGRLSVRAGVGVPG